MPLSNFAEALAAFEAGQQSVTIADARAPDMPLIYCSPGFAAFSGYRREEVLGRNCRFLQRGERDQPGLTILRQAIASKSACTVDLLNFRKDGTRMRNSLALHPVLDDAGELRFYVGLQADLTGLAHVRTKLSLMFAEKAMLLVGK